MPLAEKLVESTPTTSANTPTPASQASRRPPLVAAAPNAPARRAGAGPRGRCRRGRAGRCRRRGAPRSARPRRAAAARERARAAGRPAAARRTRRSCSDPAERRRPAQPRRALARVSADDAHEEARARAPPRRARARRRRVGASWLASAPTPTKTGTGEIVASARYGRAARGQPSRDEPERRSRARATRAPAPIAASAASVRAAAVDGAREHELLPAGLLLGAQRADRGEQPPHGGEDRTEPADPPGRVAADGQQIVRDAVEEADAPCCRRRLRAKASRSARVGYVWR